MDMDNVLISNLDLHTQKLQAMQDGGFKSLHIVADFDYTLTKATIGNERSPTTWEVFSLGDEYVNETNRLTSLYLPIEYDHSLSPEIRDIKMKEWWHLHLAQLIKHGLTREIIRDAVMQKKIIPRQGLKELCDFTHQFNIPFLIFSAGVGDVIIEFLKYHHIHYPNIHVVSNFFTFDVNGKANGFKDGIVYSGNKSEVQLRGKPYMNEIIHRKNVILLGDNLSDASMAEGLSHENIIKIGFLNQRHERLTAYESLYDIVSTEDTSLHFVTRLLSSLQR